VAALALTLVGVRDLTQRQHSIRRNYPILGNLRFFFEFVRPELRQYFLESDTEALRFRAISAASSTSAPRGSSTRSLRQPNLTCARPASSGSTTRSFPRRSSARFRVAVGGPSCRAPYSASVFNISALSFGALSPTRSSR